MNEQNNSSILQRLVIDEKDLTPELETLVQELSRHFRIEKLTGRIIFQNIGVWNNKQKILIVLMGKYFATALRLIENSWLSITEISKEIGVPITTLSSKLRELVKAGYIEYSPEPVNKYRIAYLRIREIVDE